MTTAPRTIVSDTARLLGANTLTRGVGLLALVAYARMLPPADLAALPVFLILGAFTTIPFNLGLYPTLMREVPKLLLTDEPTAIGMIRTVVLTVGGGVVIAGVGYLVFARPIASVYFESGHAAWLIRWMVAGAMVRGWDEVVTFVLRATRQYRSLASKKLVSELAQPALALLLTWKLGIRGLILGQTVGLAVGVAWGVWGARGYLFRPGQPVPLGPLARRSRPYYLEGFLFFLTQQGDQALVGALLSPAALAAYYVARRIPDSLGLILYSVEEVMGPTLARAAVDGAGAVGRVFRTMTLLVGTFVLPATGVAVSLAATYVALMGRAYYGAALSAVVLLTLSTIPQAGVTVTSQAALALGHPADRLKISATFATLLLVFTTVTANLGLIGVAAGRATAILVAGVAGFWLTRDIRPAVPWFSLAKVALVAVVLSATVLGAQALAGTVWSVPAILAAAVGVVYGARYLLSDPRGLLGLFGTRDPA